MSVGLPPTTTDIWNNGTFNGFDFGPTGKGNSLVIYDPAIQDFKVIAVNVADIVHVNIDNCWWNGNPNAIVPVGSLAGVSAELTPEGQLRIHNYPLSYTRADPQSGVMTSPWHERFTTLGMYYRHPVFGIQGQFNSEYLIGRHDLWTVGLGCHPSAPGLIPKPPPQPPITHVIPADNDWHEFGDPLDFCTWADRLPTSPAMCSFNAFGSFVDQSVSIGFGRTKEEAAANCGSARCFSLTAPINITAIATLTGGANDGFYSLKSWACANYITQGADYVRVGYAKNSTAGISVWF